MDQSMNTAIMSDTVYPPLPPSTNPSTTIPAQSNTKLIPGQFLYIKQEAKRYMLQNAWLAIQQTETADFVKKDTETFQWSSDPKIWIITAKMEELGYDGHSGFSFRWTMRQMQFIYRFGEEEFRKKWLQNDK
jgi:hypothetical protein